MASCLEVEEEGGELCDCCCCCFARACSTRSAAAERRAASAEATSAEAAEAAEAAAVVVDCIERKIVFQFSFPFFSLSIRDSLCFLCGSFAAMRGKRVKRARETSSERFVRSVETEQR